MNIFAMSGIINLDSVIKGEKDPEEANGETIMDTGKAVASGYVMGSGLTVFSKKVKEMGAI